MTEYGRGNGSEPWHPDDPLFGDLGGGQPGDQFPADGGYPAPAQPGDGWAPYGDQQPYYPQQPQTQQGYDTGWNGGQAGAQQYGAGPDPYATGQQPADPYGTGQQPADPYGTGQYGSGQYGQGQPDPYGSGQYRQSQPDPYGAGQHPADPYGTGQQPADPYGTGQQPADSYGTGQQPADPYGTGQHPAQPVGYPPAGGPQAAPPNPRGGPRRPGPGPGPEPRTGGDRETGWDPGPDQGEEAFFADDDRDDDADDEPDGRGGRRGGRSGRGGKKRRSGCACLVVAVVLAGGLGTVGYFGYDFYQTHFGAPPDFSGEGKGEVQVEIPKGSTLSDMGNILKKAGVVKSHDAFVEAAQKHQKGSGIQAGVYLLRKEMSGAEAVEMMIDPKTMNALIISEGLRATSVYRLIDEKLGLPEGSTAKVAEEQVDKLGLPEWANDDEDIRDPLEGFLFPARYDVGKSSKPAEVLRKMVERAEHEYIEHDLVGQSEKLNLDSPLEVLTVASLVQAEGKYKRDFEKVARVIYNRLTPGNAETNGRLDFDSTFNYAKNQSTLDLPTPSTMRQFEHPYNTYQQFGLPPGPIGSPGGEALDATLNPAEGNWYYFVSITAERTEFSETYAEHQKYVAEYNEASSG